MKASLSFTAKGNGYISKERENYSVFRQCNAIGDSAKAGINGKCKRKKLEEKSKSDKAK